MKCGVRRGDTYSVCVMEERVEKEKGRAGQAS